MTKEIAMNRMPRLLATSSPRTAGARRSLLASTLALAAALMAASSVASARAAEAKVAKLRITGVTVTSMAVDPTITVTGSVKLPSNTARERKRAEVYLTLTSGVGKTAETETFSAKLNSRDRFTATHTTKLSGALGLDALVKIAGRPSGKKIVKSISVAASTGSQALGDTTPVGPPGSPGSPNSPSGGGTALNGTFELQTGAQAVSGALSGTYFRMIGVENGNSPLLNQNYTPLSPGGDGGLETFAYQEPPSPAFEKVSQTGEPTGNALASRIVQPQEFFGVAFSIVTAPTDPQEGLSDPLPQIVDTDGELSGQITDWNAQWNGQSFNQGSPKPDGQYPTGGLPASRWGEGGTIPLQGTYTAATGHYTLEWQSLIEGGPFGGFTGYWHLEGTFVPQT
jgi:hypothetical protein